MIDIPVKDVLLP